MEQMMENPMVLGDYYRLSAPLPDTEENRLAYISEQNLGWQAAAAGLRVDPFSRDAIRDYLEEAWSMFLSHRPATAKEWAEELLDLDPYNALYREWREEARLCEAM